MKRKKKNIVYKNKSQRTKQDDKNAKRGKYKENERKNIFLSKI